MHELLKLSIASAIADPKALTSVQGERSEGTLPAALTPPRPPWVPMGPHAPSVGPRVPMGSPWVHMGSPWVPAGSSRGPHAVPMSPHGVAMNPHGYDLSRLVPAVVQPSVTVVAESKPGSASLTMSLKAVMSASLDAQRKRAAAAQRAEGQPQRLRSDLKQKRHSP